ncbi:hypothetical protein Tco_0633627 [Tanacetum coccineum]
MTLLAQLIRATLSSDDQSTVDLSNTPKSRNIQRWSGSCHSEIVQKGTGYVCRSQISECPLCGVKSNVIPIKCVDMGNSNVIPYEQYFSVDNIFVVPSCASSPLNDVCVSSDNDAFIPHDPIATELKIYKEQVAIYEQRAKFELTEREQRMDDQMRMLIQNHNKMEENLKKELHSIKF